MPNPTDISEGAQWVEGTERPHVEQEGIEAGQILGFVVMIAFLIGLAVVALFQYTDLTAQEVLVETTDRSAYPELEEVRLHAAALLTQYEALAGPEERYRIPIATGHGTDGAGGAGPSRGVLRPRIHGHVPQEMIARRKPYRTQARGTARRFLPALFAWVVSGAAVLAVAIAPAFGQSTDTLPPQFEGIGLDQRDRRRAAPRPCFSERGRRRGCPRTVFRRQTSCVVDAGLSRVSHHVQYGAARADRNAEGDALDARRSIRCRDGEFQPARNTGAGCGEEGYVPGYAGQARSRRGMAFSYGRGRFDCGAYGNSGVPV